MPELQLTRVTQRLRENALTSVPKATTAERELLTFIEAVIDLLGPEHTGFLREVWLDELASLDSMPSPTSADWRLVTVAASARLAGRLIDLPHRHAAL